MEPASVSVRAAAFLVDLAIAGLMGALVLEATDGQGILVEALGVLAALLAVTYAFVFKDVIDGAGVGKRLFEIAVRRKDNVQKAPTIVQVVVRTLLLTLYPIEFIVMLSRPDKRRWGDLLADTIVVKTSVIKRCVICSEYGYDAFSVDREKNPTEIKKSFKPIELDGTGVCQKCRKTTHNNAMESDA